MARIAKETPPAETPSGSRQDGTEQQSDKQRLRDPARIREREQRARNDLKHAADDLGTDTLRISAYRRWRKTTNLDTLSEAQVKQLLGPWQDALAAAGLHAAYERSWDHNDVTSWLQQAAAGSETLSQATYNQWRNTHQPDALSAQRMHAIIGWRNALTRAGLKRATYQPRYTNNDSIFALHGCAGGAYVTKTKYDKWRKQQRETHPSASTICAQFGTWKQACSTANLKPADEFDDKQTLNYINQATEDLGRHPTQRQYARWATECQTRPGLAIVTRRYSFATKSLTSPAGKENNHDH